MSLSNYAEYLYVPLSSVSTWSSRSTGSAAFPEGLLIWLAAGWLRRSTSAENPDWSATKSLLVCPRSPPGADRLPGLPSAGFDKSTC